MFQALILGVCHHWVENLKHILGHWAYDGLVDLQEIFGGEAVVLEVAERPVTFPEPALDNVQVGPDRWFGRKMPTKDLQPIPRVDSTAVLVHDELLTSLRWTSQPRRALQVLVETPLVVVGVESLGFSKLLFKGKKREKTKEKQKTRGKVG